MSSEQVLLSDELLNVMRGAVNYANEYDANFVGPPHLLLALLDDPKIGGTLLQSLERGRIIAAARQPPASGTVASRPIASITASGKPSCASASTSAPSRRDWRSSASVAGSRAWRS